MPDMKLFAGNATPELAQRIANRLYTSLGDAAVGRFSDGEVSVQINENVRGGDIFIIQSTCAPTNDNLMELVVMVDALRRASAGRITAVIPYFGYARQDRRVRSARVPITAKVVADFLSSVGVDRVLTVDLHAEQIQGFFDVPVDNVFGSPILLEDMLQLNLDNPIVVSRTSAAWCVLAPSPNCSTIPTWQSSTNVVRVPTSPRSCILLVTWRVVTVCWLTT